MLLTKTEKAVITALWLGKFQQGKTVKAVRKSLKDMQNYKEVQVFIAYGMHIVKQNQENHIKIIYHGVDYTLINTIQELRALAVDLQKGVYPSNNIVISLLGNSGQLGALIKLLSIKSTLRFQIWVDESDTYGLNFKRQHIKVQKDNLIDSIKSLEYKLVRKINLITATPTTELACSTDFDEVHPLPLSKNYIGLEDIKLNKCSEDSIVALNRGVVKSDVLQFLSSQCKIKNSVTIISTKKYKESHVAIAKAVSSKMPATVLTAVVNSMYGGKFYCKGRLTSRQYIQPSIAEIFEIAKIKGYEKLIIVGHDSLDRSITLKDNANVFSISGMIFNCSENSPLASALQRLARVCGYQTLIPEILTPKVAQLKLGIASLNEIVEGCLQYPKYKERNNYIMTQLDPSKYKNLFGSKNNAVAKRVNMNERDCVFSSQEEAEAADFPCITKSKEYSYGELIEKNPKAFQQLIDEEKAVKNSHLYNFLISIWITSRRILNALDDSKSRANMQKPNQVDSDENFRDTLYLLENQKLKVVHQPYEWIREGQAYSIEDIMTGEFHAYKGTKTGFIRR